MTIRKISVGLLVGFVTLVACTKQLEQVKDVFPGFGVPSNFGTPVYPVNGPNKVTEAVFILGRTLFYEGKLSRDNTISCGSCHIQSAAFTHHGHDLSHGIDDLLGRRNAPSIANAAWYQHFFWDGGVFNLDLLSLAPIQNPVEMDETMPNILRKLRSTPKYPSLFSSAFGDTSITGTRVLQALSQFMLMCISSNSKYDSVMRKEPGVQFTQQEQAGYQIYKNKCSTCHTEPLLTNNQFANNGLPLGINPDEGRYEVTLNAADKYKFKVPTLRNLQYTAPYMHDGRLLTLNAVLNHYQTGMVNTGTVHPQFFSNGQLVGIPLTPTEREQLLAFLNTLNDKVLVTNKLLAEQ